MLKAEYKFALVMFDSEGAPLGSAAVEPDWEPAVQWARFWFQRRGELSFHDGNGPVSILPLWDREAHEPYCRGFRVSFAREGQPACTSDFPVNYVRRLAAKAAAVFVEKGKLEQNETFRYALVALAGGEKAEAVPTSGMQVEERVVTLPVQESSLAEWQQRSTPVGHIDPDDFPIFVPQLVLDQVAEQTLAERGRETGGILIGKLHRDRAVSDMFVEITAMISAEYTEGDAVKLTFTADTWVAVNNAIKLRGGDELHAGYFHSHPVRNWCASRECSLEKQANCKLAKDFFSADDEAVMRAVFPRGHSVALVANDTAFQDLTFSWFGWREGSIQPRGYYLLGDHNAT